MIVGAPSATGVAVRATRNSGYVACLVGTLLMIAGRFMPGAPTWLVYVGVSGIVAGWGLFGYSALQRAAITKARSDSGETLSPKS